MPMHISYLCFVLAVMFLVVPITEAKACQCRMSTEQGSRKIIEDAKMIVRGEVMAVEQKRGLNPNATHSARLKILEIYKTPVTGTLDMTVIEVYFDGTSRCGNHYLKTGETRDFIIRGFWAHGETDQLQLDEPCKHQEILEEDWQTLRSSGNSLDKIVPAKEEPDDER